MKTEKKKITDLIPDDKNFNKGTEKGHRLLEKSLRELGAGRSILIDKNNRIIAGNKTAEEAAAIGLNDVIVVETDGTKVVAVKRTDVDLDSEQGRKMALADNSVGAANLEFDEDLIAEVAEEFDFDAGEWGIMTELIGGNEKEAKDDDFDENKAHIEVRCKRGDIWQLGEHRLMCGDSIDLEDVKRLMGEGVKADMVFTDPPYGVAIGDKNAVLNELNGSKSIDRNIMNDKINIGELKEILVKAMTNCRMSCKDDAVYYVTSPQGGELGMMMMMMMMMRDSGLPVRHILIWCKNNATFSLGRLDYDYQHEPIFYTWTKSHHNYRKGENRTTLWHYNKPQKSELHPTMKPVELVANCIKDGTKEGDVVLDMFGGSGTTLIAAEQMNRKCYMMELDPHYCDVIIARWEQLTGEKALKIAS